MWKTVKLGDLADVLGGNGFPKKYQGRVDGDIPFLKVSDMNLDGNEKLMIHANNYVTSSVLTEIKAKAHPAGTIIFPKIGGAISTNKKRILTKSSAFDNNIMGVVPSAEMLPEYLFKIFLNLDLYELSNKAALPSITSGAVKDIDIPLPPMPVQKQTVEKLDKVFENISKKIQLTEENIVKTNNLLTSYLRIIFKNNLKKQYAIEEIANINYGTRVVKKRDSGSMYDVYGGGGKTFKVDSFNRENCFIVSRFGMSEECVRRVEGKFFLNDSGLTVDTKDSNVITQQYIDWFLLSKMSDIYLLGRGTAQKNLDVVKFKSIPIQVLSLKEQNKIVNKLDQMSNTILKLISNYKEQLLLLSKLQASYLNKELFYE